jgi:protocatechuate 3,4-dioxygenase beta subunit
MMLRLLSAALLFHLSSCAEPARATPCEAAQSSATIVADAGAAPLRIEGQVVRSDGETPAADVIVYVFHTGANGSYEVGADGRPRRDAFLRTDASGRFVLTTSMPGPYPDSSEPAHVHLQLWGGGAPAQWADDVLFADDRLVSDETRRRSAAAARFAWVSEAPSEDGVRVVRRVIRLKREGDRFERVTSHGIDACRER